MECDRTYSVNILQKIAGAVKNGKNWYESTGVVIYQTETVWLEIAFSGKKVMVKRHKNSIFSTLFDKPHMLK